MGHCDPDIDRLIAAYTIKKHDRVPNFDYIDPKNVNLILGRNTKERQRSDYLPAEEAVKLAKLTHQDYIHTLLHYWPLVDVEEPRGKLCNWSDLDKTKTPDYAALLDRVNCFIAAVAGSNIGVGIGIAGPFFSSYMSVGAIPIQSFLLNTYDDLPFIKRVMNIQVQTQIDILESVRGREISFIEIADDLCDNTGFMVDPKFMWEIREPRMKRVVDVATSIRSRKITGTGSVWWAT